MNNPTPRRATRRAQPPLWLYEGLDIVEQRRRLLLAVAGLVILVGIVVSLVLPGVLARTAGTGIAVGVAALLLGIAAVVAADATDLLVRGPRHVRAAGGELVAVLPTEASVERAGPLADAVLEARASGEGPLRIGVAASGREAARVAAWTDALGDALTEHGMSVLRVDLASGPGPSPGLVEVIEDGARLVDSVAIEPGSKLARLGPGADVRRALAALPSLAVSLPRDLDVLLVSLPAAASRAVVTAVGPLDHVLVVAQRSRTSRVELIAGLDAVEDGGTAAQVLLLDDAAAGWLASRSSHVDAPEAGGQPAETRSGATEPTAAGAGTAALDVDDPPPEASSVPAADDTTEASSAPEGDDAPEASSVPGAAADAPGEDAAAEDVGAAGEVDAAAAEDAGVPEEADAPAAMDDDDGGDAELGDLALAPDAGVAPTAYPEVASPAGPDRHTAEDEDDPAGFGDEGGPVPAWDQAGDEPDDVPEEPVAPRDVDVLLGAARATAEEATAAEAEPVDLPDDLPPPRPATPDRTYRSEPLTLDDEHQPGREPADDVPDGSPERSPEPPPEGSSGRFDRELDEAHASAHATDELPRIEAPGRRHDDAEEDLLRTTAQLALLELAHDADDHEGVDGDGAAVDRSRRR